MSSCWRFFVPPPTSLFKRSDQAANGLCPPRSRYSRTSTIANGNTCGTIVKTTRPPKLQPFGGRSYLPPRIKSTAFWACEKRQKQVSANPIRAMRHPSPETKRHYQLGMAEQVRQAVEKPTSGCTESGHRFISVTVCRKTKRRKKPQSVNN
jgi:hypothetical protein